MKKKFDEWFAQQLVKQLSLGKKVEEIRMKFHLMEKKTIYAKWVTKFCNQRL